MSKRQPSRSTVRLMPPTTSSPSRMVLETPAFISWNAAVSPAGPAPTMSTRGLPAPESAAVGPSVS